jgi:hypothetical protein
MWYPLLPLSDRCSHRRTGTRLSAVERVDTLLEVGVTDVAIAALAKQCDRLEFLQIRSCERVTTDVVCVLAEYCKKLKRLTLCRSFTGQDFSKLVNAGTTVHFT